MHATRALYLQGNVQWDSDDFAFRRTNLDLFYDPGDNDRLFNFSYRFTKNDPAFIDRQEINQINLSLLWPINDQWRTMARWNYSLKEARNMDLFGGFEYSDCCWALRFVVRSNRPNPQNAPKNSVFAELELKGFTSLGSSVTSLMEKYIRGYTRPSY
jgi:LPS-assembly protein